MNISDKKIASAVEQIKQEVGDPYSDTPSHKENEGSQSREPL